jgi:anti-sigma B factor antagonist
MQTVLAKTKIKVVQPEGYINACNAPDFQNSLNAAILCPNNHGLLVDFGQVHFIDGVGLMALISAFKLAKSLNRRFSICSVLPSIRMIFEITQLDRAFEIFENRNSFELTYLNFDHC